MITSLQSRLHWALVWGTAAGLAGLPAEMAAQSGPGQPSGRLDAWMAEARASSFHASIQAAGMANLVADHAGQAGAWAPHRVPAGSNSAASPGKVFLSTLAGAAIPFAPFMLYWHFWLEEPPSQGDDPGLALLLISSANLLTVPMAAGIAGVDSLGRTLIGTGLGFVLGTMATQFTDLRDSEHTLAPPVFALTMAAVTTLAITIHEGDRRGPG